MYYTKCLPLVLLALTGCAGIAPHEPASGIITGGEPLSASADKETNLYRQAITALNNSQLEQAETDLKTITQGRPEFAGPWINLALIDIQKKNLEAAEKNLAQALERNPKMPQIFNARRLKVPLDNFPKIVAVEAACLKLSAFDKARPENQPDAE